MQAHGGRAERNGRAWNLTWPDGESGGTVVFSAGDADRSPLARHLTLAAPRVRELVTRIPPFAPGQPIPCLALQGLPAEVRGFWSLWRITLHAADGNRHRVMPLVGREDGRVLVPTARFVWDQMLAGLPPICGHFKGSAATAAFDLVYASVRDHGQQIYRELVQTYRARLAAEREKGEDGFADYRLAIDLAGLPAVRDHRLVQLAAEERSWCERRDRKAETSPEVAPLVLVHVEGRSAGA